jgi:hypothetical protein
MATTRASPAVVEFSDGNMPLYVIWESASGLASSVWSQVAAHRNHGEARDVMRQGGTPSTMHLSREIGASMSGGASKLCMHMKYS